MFVESIFIRYLLNQRQINFSAFSSYRSFLKNGSQGYIFRNFYDNCLLGSILKFQMPSQVRYFKICHSLRNYAENESYKERKTIKKSKSNLRKNDIKVIVTNENGSKSSMFLSEAEKYAVHNNLSLIKVNNSNYRFEKEKHILMEKTNLKDDFKKFIVRDSIADHDLQIKINSMLKYVEKYGVLCAIENVHNKLNEVSNKIKNSLLQEFAVSENKSSKRIILTFKKKGIGNNESSRGNNFNKRVKNNQSVIVQSDQVKNEQ